MFFQGNELWLEELDSNFHDEFAAAKSQPWVTLAGGKIAGTVRSAGATEFSSGNITYVQVYDAGYVLTL